MGKTSIEWTEKVWNPVRGCSRVSPGCQNCYAERQSARFTDLGQYAHGFAERTKSGPRWTGRVELIPDKLAEPLSWRKPAMVFVNSMSDLFHEKLSDEDIAAVFGVMAACPLLTFQVLTKRAKRLTLLDSTDGLESFEEAVARHAERIAGIIWDPRGQERHLYPAGAGDLSRRRIWPGWPLPNVWIGTSVENQQEADGRVPFLLQAPAAVRFLSCEPLLGPVEVVRYLGGRTYRCRCGFHETENELIFTGGEDYFCPKCQERCAISKPGIGWVICGGESGPGARPMHPEWARSLRDQCAAAKVPFFFKQWGAWQNGSARNRRSEVVLTDGRHAMTAEALGFKTERDAHGRYWADLYPVMMAAVGKKAAGRVLDGRTWDEMPEVAQ